MLIIEHFPMDEETTCNMCTGRYAQVQISSTHPDRRSRWLLCLSCADQINKDLPNLVHEIQEQSW